MYIVVFKSIAGYETKGATTRTTFKDKKDFDKWYDDKMRIWYEVVDQGITMERAIDICSSNYASQLTTSKLL